MEDRSLTTLRRIAGVNAVFAVETGAAPQPGASEPGSPATAAREALLSAVVAALGQATDDMELGALSEVIVEAERGAVVAGALPGGRTAVVVAEAGANLGMIRVELRKLRRGI